MRRASVKEARGVHSAEDPGSIPGPATNIPDWLRPYGKELDHGCPFIGYALDELRKKFDVRELPGGWLVLKHDSTFGNWMQFTVLQFATSNSDGSNEFGSIVFYGDGPGGKPDESLRECRHTYWGEDGYIFYPNGKLISSAFAALSEFYDELA